MNNREPDLTSSLTSIAHNLSLVAIDMSDVAKEMNEHRRCQRIVLTPHFALLHLVARQRECIEALEGLLEIIVRREKPNTESTQ